ncbi:MAG: flagellar hook-length control protein FliK [Methylophaga sp.]
MTDKDAEATPFSAQFSQQMAHSQSVSKQDSAETALAANKTEPEQDIAADGNNLPDGEAQPVSDEQQETENQQTADSDQPGTAEGEENSSTAQNSAEVTPEHVVAVQAGVSLQGDRHSETGAAEIKAVTKQLVTSGALSEPGGDEQRQAQKATPNLATVLKQIAEEEAESPKIRADIKNALQGQQSKPEVTINPRNLLAGKAQPNEVKPAVTLPLTLSHNAVSETGQTALSPLSVGGLLSSHSGGTASVLGQPTLSLPVHPNMQNPVWAQVMSSRVVWMAKEGVQQAELRMNPVNLGPVEVKLHVQNDQASVTFLAQQGATREALEQALPRLRESFADSGLQLAHAEVGEHQHEQHERSEQTQDSHIFAQASHQDDDIESEAVESVGSAEITAGLSLYA